MEALKAFPAGETAHVLSGAAGLNAKDFGRAIAGLLRDGLAEAVQITKTRGTYDGYKLSKR